MTISASRSIKTKSLESPHPLKKETQITKKKGSSEIWSDSIYDSWPRRCLSSEIRSVVVHTATHFLYRMTLPAVLPPEVAKHREAVL